MLRRWADATARTTTSVSSVWMDTLLYPCFTASSMWSRIRVSSSSWVHGARPDTSRDWLRCDVRQEHLGRVIGKCLCKTRSKRVNDCSPIKQDDLYDRSGERSCVGTRSSKQPTRSDFVSVRSFPICDKAGGYAWFSCWKNWSRSPLRICDAMYNLENREQPLLSDDRCSCALDFSRTGGRLNSSRLFLLIGSVMGFVWLTRRSLT